MGENVDPRLAQLIDEAGEEDEVEAVVTLDKGAASDVDLDERGVGGRVLDRVVERLHEKPSDVRFLPRLGVLYVKGKRRLIQQLLEEEEVRSASSTEAEFTLLEE